MISPLLIGAALDLAGLSFSSIIGQFQSARNSHFLIKSNEELGRKAGLNQLKIAEMQIRNLQEIEQRNREMQILITEKQIKATSQLAELNFSRDLVIKNLEFQA